MSSILRTLASQRLNLSQSAVSLKIQRLEGLLDRKVFIRSRHSLELTREGDLVLGYSRRLLDLSQEMLLLVAQPAVEGILRLGVVQQFGPEFLPNLLAQFKRRHPNVCLTVEVGMTPDLLLALEADQLDLVLGLAGCTPGPGAKINAFTEDRIVLREPLVWVEGAQSSIDPKKDPVPLILFAAPCSFRKLATELMEKAGRPWQRVYSSASLASIQAAVQAELGISILGKSSVLSGMCVISPRAGLPALPDSALALSVSSETLARSAHSFGRRCYWSFQNLSDIYLFKMKELFYILWYAPGWEEVTAQYIGGDALSCYRSTPSGEGCRGDRETAGCTLGQCITLAYKMASGWTEGS